jgi:hypothetical protein
MCTVQQDCKCLEVQAFISGKVSKFKLGRRVQETPRREGRKSVICQDSGDEAFSVVRGLERRSR